MKRLSDEKIRNIIDKAEEEYEDVPMTDEEWEEKRWSIIAQTQLKDDRKRMVEWGESHCPHVTHFRGKHWCGECWETLKEEGVIGW